MVTVRYGHILTVVLVFFGIATPLIMYSKYNQRAARAARARDAREASEENE
jgi:large-conductance mechanosensitive channel